MIIGNTKGFIRGKALSTEGHTHDDRYYTESEMNTKLNAKANSSHTHDASNIISGVIPVSRGGTGQTNLNDLISTIGVAKTMTGSYVGTGTYGSSSPNSLTFEFAPKLILFFMKQYGSNVIYGISNQYIKYYIPCFILTTSFQLVGFPSVGNQDDNAYAAKSEDGKTIKWYNSYSSDASQFQLNQLNSIYYYIAIS